MKLFSTIALCSLMTISSAVSAQEIFEPSEEFKAKLADLFPTVTSKRFFKLDHEMVGIGVITPDRKKKIYYTNLNGDYITTGLYDVQTKRSYNPILDKQMDAFMPELPETLTGGLETLPYISVGEGDQVVYAVVDPQCGFCKRLHEKVNAMKTAGKLENVEFRYIPVNSLGERSTALSSAIMSKESNEDKLSALVSAMNRQPIDMTTSVDGQEAVSTNRAFMNQFPFMSGVPYVITNLNGTWKENPGLPGNGFFNDVEMVSTLAAVEKKATSEPEG